MSRTGNAQEKIRSLFHLLDFTWLDSYIVYPIDNERNMYSENTKERDGSTQSLLKDYGFYK